MAVRQFSKELSKWAAGKEGKTFVGLADMFGKDAYAVLILLLMAIPALPVPTGGVTHIFEIITMLLALQLIIGRARLWLPKRWQNRSLESFSRGKVFLRLIAVIRWFERFTRPRWSGLVDGRVFISVTGLFILIFAVAAFVAPPFSGLDTLPSLGVVVLSLALIFSDMLLFGLGLVLGSVGIGLIFTIGTAIYHLF